MFGSMVGWDKDNSFTGTWGSELATDVRVYSVDQTGTANDPKLVVEHSAAPAADAPSQESDLILFGF